MALSPHHAGAALLAVVLALFVLGGASTDSKGSSAEVRTGLTIAKATEQCPRRRKLTWRNRSTPPKFRAYVFGAVRADDSIEAAVAADVTNIVNFAISHGGVVTCGFELQSAEALISAVDHDKSHGTLNTLVVIAGHGFQSEDCKVSGLCFAQKNDGQMNHQVFADEISQLMKRGSRDSIWWIVLTSCFSAKLKAEMFSEDVRDRLVIMTSSDIPSTSTTFGAEGVLPEKDRLKLALSSHTSDGKGVHSTRTPGTSFMWRLVHCLNSVTPQNTGTFGDAWQCLTGRKDSMPDVSTPPRDHESIPSAERYSDNGEDESGLLFVPSGDFFATPEYAPRTRRRLSREYTQSKANPHVDWPRSDSNIALARFFSPTNDGPTAETKAALRSSDLTVAKVEELCPRNSKRQLEYPNPTTFRAYILGLNGPTTHTHSSIAADVYNFRKRVLKYGGAANCMMDIASLQELRVALMAMDGRVLSNGDRTISLSDMNTMVFISGPGFRYEDAEEDNGSTTGLKFSEQDVSSWTEIALDLSDIIEKQGGNAIWWIIVNADYSSYFTLDLFQPSVQRRVILMSSSHERMADFVHKNIAARKDGFQSVAYRHNEEVVRTYGRGLSWRLLACIDDSEQTSTMSQVMDCLNDDQDGLVRESTADYFDYFSGEEHAQRRQFAVEPKLEIGSSVPPPITPSLFFKGIQAQGQGTERLDRLSFRSDVSVKKVLDRCPEKNEDAWWDKPEYKVRAILLGYEATNVYAADVWNFQELFKDLPIEYFCSLDYPRASVPPWQKGAGEDLNTFLFLDSIGFEYIVGENDPPVYGVALSKSTQAREHMPLKTLAKMISAAMRPGESLFWIVLNFAYSAHLTLDMFDEDVRHRIILMAATDGQLPRRDRYTTDFRLLSKKGSVSAVVDGDGYYSYGQGLGWRLATCMKDKTSTFSEVWQCLTGQSDARGGSGPDASGLLRVPSLTAFRPFGDKEESDSSADGELGPTVTYGNRRDMPGITMDAFFTSQ